MQTSLSQGRKTSRESAITQRSSMYARTCAVRGGATTIQVNRRKPLSHTVVKVRVGVAIAFWRRSALFSTNEKAESTTSCLWSISQLDAKRETTSMYVCVHTSRCMSVGRLCVLAFSRFIYCTVRVCLAYLFGTMHRCCHTAHFLTMCRTKLSH